MLQLDAGVAFLLLFEDTNLDLGAFYALTRFALVTSASLP